MVVIKLGDFKHLDVAAVGSFISSAACRSCELDPAPTWIIKKYANVLIHLNHFNVLLAAILDFGSHIENI